MQIALLIITILILTTLLAALYLFLNAQSHNLAEEKSPNLMLDIVEKMRKELLDSNSRNRQEVQEKIDKITDQMFKQQRATAASLQKQFDKSNDIVESVTEKLKDIEHTNKQVLGYSEQLQSLENILKNPKQRGLVGEFFLENLLSNVLPPANFKMQYMFSNGETVDAVIFAKDKLIPIDAKFTLENYNRFSQETNRETRQKWENEFKKDLKKRIDETSKYIRPEENTMDFALMFIPADGIFYNLLVQKRGNPDVNTEDFINYAHKKGVTLVSPMTFYAFLQTILHALRSMQIEESAKEIRKRVGDLHRHLNAYQDFMTKLGSNISTVVNTYNSSSREFKKIDRDVEKISGDQHGGSYEPSLIEKPQRE